MDPLLPSLSRLSDADLVIVLGRLAERERAATADLVAALMAFDARRLYLGEGCSSLFTYCTTRLHLSESAAYLRIEAARAARAHPLVLEALRTGTLTLTAIKLLAPHLTDANHVNVLAAAAGRRTDEIKELIARLAPRPDVPSSVRKLPEPKTAGASDGDARAAAPSLLRVAPDVAHETSAAARATADRPTVGASQARPAVVRPAAPTRYRLQVTVSAEARAALGRLQDLLRREIPSGDPAAIVERALTLLLAQVERRKCAALHGRPARKTDDAGAGAKPAGATSPPAPPATIATRPPVPMPRTALGRSRRIPAAVRREVWRRDEGQCTYVSAAGQRCASRSLLEFHHRVAVADGGLTTVENLRLLCAPHHDAESARVFDWRRGPAAGPDADATGPGTAALPFAPTERGV